MRDNYDSYERNGWKWRFKNEKNEKLLKSRFPIIWEWRHRTVIDIDTRNIPRTCFLTGFFSHLLSYITVSQYHSSQYHSITLVSQLHNFAAPTLSLSLCTLLQAALQFEQSEDHLTKLSLDGCYDTMFLTIVNQACCKATMAFTIALSHLSHCTFITGSIHSDQFCNLLT